MDKYNPLYVFLSKKADNRITLKFSEIENIIGDKLPKSARMYSAWWSNSQTNAHPYSRSWIDAGYKTVDVATGISNEEMVFFKS